jgi:hypothetical protein
MDFRGLVPDERSEFLLDVQTGVTAGRVPGPGVVTSVAVPGYFHSQLWDESLPFSSMSSSITVAMVLIRASRSEVVWP